MIKPMRQREPVPRRKAAKARGIVDELNRKTGKSDAEIVASIDFSEIARAYDQMNKGLVGFAGLFTQTAQGIQDDLNKAVSKAITKQSQEIEREARDQWLSKYISAYGPWSPTPTIMDQITKFNEQNENKITQVEGNVVGPFAYVQGPPPKPRMTLTFADGTTSTMETDEVEDKLSKFVSGFRGIGVESTPGTSVYREPARWPLPINPNSFVQRLRGGETLSIDKKIIGGYAELQFLRDFLSKEADKANADATFWEQIDLDVITIKFKPRPLATYAGTIDPGQWVPGSSRAPNGWLKDGTFTFDPFANPTGYPQSQDTVKDAPKPPAEPPDRFKLIDFD